MPLKEFSLPLALLLIALLVYLLLLGRLTPGAFATALIGVLGIGVAVAIVGPRAEDVTELGVKAHGAELLVKMERIQRDVYAKADTVRDMAETVAEMASFSLARIGRFAPNDLDAELLRGRARIADMLSRVGTSEPRIADLTRPITDAILFDLIVAVWSEVNSALGDQPRAMNREELRATLTEKLRSSAVGNAAAAVRRTLEDLKIWTPNVQQRVAEFDEFRRSGRLPTSSPGRPATIGGLQ